MSRPTLIFTLSLVALVTTQTQFAVAQRANPPVPPAASQGQDWYSSPTTPTPATKSFSQQKARLRAEQRIARLEANRRYGLTPNRPTAEALPFTSAHPLSWMRAGRSPFSTYRNDRPLVYYSYPYAFYR